MSDLFLIASQDAEIVNSIQAALRDAEHATVTASNGLAALDLALDRVPKAVFISPDLPKMDGVALARALRAIQPTDHIPIIFLAANDAEAKQITEEHLPFSDCLIAPFQANDLKRRASNALRNGARLSELRQRDNSGILYAIHDPLTHVYQRRYVVNRLAYEASRSVRYKNPLTVLLVDVDNLQMINREHGIVIGDSVLIETAELLRKVLRTSDLIGRYDAQDFLIVLPQTGQAGAETLARRICGAVSHHKYLNGKIELNVSVSVGVAGADGADLPENLVLIGRAAMALDQAKQAGKNRVALG